MVPTENIYLKGLEKLYLDKIAYWSKKLDAVKVLLSDEESEASGNSVQVWTSTIKHMVIPNTYAECINQDEKVMFALKYIGGEGFYTQVADAITMLDPTFNLVRATKLAQQKLSHLKKHDYLEYEQIGIKYKYKIPKPLQ